jgi:hypothetical protein
VPAALAVATIGAALATVHANAGCGDSSPRPADAAIDAVQAIDAAPDTPIA